MQNQHDLNVDTDAFFGRIHNIREMIKELGSGEDIELDFEEETQINTEYQEYILNYIETIKNQIEENHEEFEQLYRLKAILEQNIEKLSDSLNVARKQIERQNIKLSSMSKAKSDFNNKQKEFELTIRDYQSQIREFKKGSHELDKKINEITKKNSELAQEVSELTTLNISLESEKDQLEKDYFNLNENLIGSEQALKEKQEEYDRINERISIIDKQVQSNEDNTDDLLQENIALGEGIIEMEKTLTYMKKALFKFMEFIRPDLPKKSIFKILFTLIENKTVKVKEFETLTNITSKKAYTDLKELESLGLVMIDRQSARNYIDYTVKFALGD